MDHWRGFPAQCKLLHPDCLTTHLRRENFFKTRLSPGSPCLQWWLNTEGSLTQLPAPCRSWFLTLPRDPPAQEIKIPPCLLGTEISILLPLKPTGILAFISTMRDGIPKCLFSSSGRMPALIKSIEMHFQGMANPNIYLQTPRLIPGSGISFAVELLSDAAWQRHWHVPHLSSAKTPVPASIHIRSLYRLSRTEMLLTFSSSLME